MKARIYRHPRLAGIVAAVENPKGECFVGYKSPGKKYFVKEDTGYLKGICGDWETVQAKLDETAREYGLKELPWNL